MQKEMNAGDDEELHDTLIAISVVAKQLAKKINQEGKNVQVLRTDGKDHQC